MALDVDSVVSQMLAAAQGPLQQYWKSAGPVAESQFTNIAQMIEQIGVDRATETITPQDAQNRLQMAKNDAQAALDALEGLGELAAQNAINAALSAVSGIVNGYLGFALI